MLDLRHGTLYSLSCSRRDSLLLSPRPGSPSPLTMNDDHSAAAGSSGPSPAADLTSTLYGELRKLAAARMAAERGPQTLQATALVHEAWLRVGGEKQPDWVSRAQFFAASAEAMRRILVDRARKRQAARHGGGQIRVDMEGPEWDHIQSPASLANDETLLALHEALEKLTESDPECAELVKLRYFAGMNTKECAEALGLSPRTAERRLAFAKAWLSREMETR